MLPSYRVIVFADVRSKEDEQSRFVDIQLEGKLPFVPLGKMDICAKNKNGKEAALSVTEVNWVVVKDSGYFEVHASQAQYGLISAQAIIAAFKHHGWKGKIVRRT